MKPEIVGYWVEMVPVSKRMTAEFAQRHIDRCQGRADLDKTPEQRAAFQGIAMALGCISRSHAYSPLAGGALPIFPSRAAAAKAGAGWANEFWTFAVRISFGGGGGSEQ